MLFFNKRGDQQTSCDRMDHIIRQKSAIIRCRTKEYVGGGNILDIERSADSS